MLLPCVKTSCTGRHHIEGNLGVADTDPVHKRIPSFLLIFLYNTLCFLAEIRDVFPKRKRAIPSTNMIKNIGAPDHLDIRSSVSAMQILRSVFPFSTFFSPLRFCPD